MCKVMREKDVEMIREIPINFFRLEETCPGALPKIIQRRI